MRNHKHPSRLASCLLPPARRQGSSQENTSDDHVRLFRGAIDNQRYCASRAGLAGFPLRLSDFCTQDNHPRYRKTDSCPCWAPPPDPVVQSECCVVGNSRYIIGAEELFYGTDCLNLNEPTCQTVNTKQRRRSVNQQEKPCWSAYPVQLMFSKTSLASSRREMSI